MQCFLGLFYLLFPQLLAALECGRVKDLKDRDAVAASIKTAVMSKQYGHEDFLSKLICDACLSIMPDHQKSFNVDRIRVCKIMVSWLYATSEVLKLSSVHTLTL